MDANHSHLRPSISATSSTSSCSSNSSVTSPTYLSPIMPSHSHLSGAAAPLPSPIASDETTYFSSRQPSHQTQLPFLSQQERQQQREILAQQQYQHQQQLQLQFMLQQQQHQHSHNTRASAAQQAQQQQQAGYGYHSQRHTSTSSTDSDASSYLKDFSLIAEAAKRAQVACVTRDFEEFGL